MLTHHAKIFQLISSKSYSKSQK